jgi:hypothetical protein
LSNFQDFSFQLRASFANLLEAGRKDHEAVNTCLCTIANDARNRRGRRDYDSEIGDLRKVGDGRVSLDSQNIWTFGVHWVDGPAKRTADEIPEDGSTYAAGAFAGSNDGDALGRKDVFEGSVASRLEQLYGGLLLTLAYSRHVLGLALGGGWD